MNSITHLSIVTLVENDEPICSGKRKRWRDFGWWISSSINSTSYLIVSFNVSINSLVNIRKTAGQRSDNSP